MKVSVIVPVYNVEKYLRKCLDSLVNQTLKDIEIIIINDGSPDNSEEIIKEYEKKYKDKIKTYKKENAGLGAARNDGTKMAIGEYICYVDSDDYVDLDMLEKLYTKAKQNKSDIVIFENDVVDETYSKVDNNRINVFENCPNNFKYILNSNVCVWNKLYKKDLIVENDLSFRKGVWYEDIDFSAKSLVCAKNISIVNETLYHYLLRQGSIMNNSNVKRNLELLEAFDEIKKYLQEKKVYKDYYNELEYLCISHLYISCITRIISANSSMKNKKIIINQALEYINNDYPNFKKNQYLVRLGKKKRIIYKLVQLKMYNVINLIFKIKNRM